MLSTITGAGCTLEEFYQLYDKFSLRKEEVEQIKTEEKKIEEAFPSGPPCLNKLASTGFGEGLETMHYLILQFIINNHNPDTWEDEIVKANSNIWILL